MLKFLSGNLLNSNAYALVNKVNTVGVMSKGIALQFENEFPYNYMVYRNPCLKHELKVGRLLTVQDTSVLMGERLIINFPTKTHWRMPSQYSYVEQGLNALIKTITDKNIPSIAIPPLGCGNGDLDWSIVKQMITTSLGKLPADIQVFEPPL